MQTDKDFITLGIETSCDETACAVLQGAQTLRSNVVASSMNLHKRFGGIVPEIASRHCLEYMQLVFDRAVRQAHITKYDIDLIGVTYGPGLVGSLLVGLSFAKALSYALRVPLIGVNHLEGHLYANFIRRSYPKKPFVGLIVSGGHTSLVHCYRNRFDLIGETRDDAVGEAFDKVAKMLDIGFPGGPVIERIAKKGDPTSIRFTSAKLPGTFDFSFSGVKTAVLYYTQKCQNLSREVPNICASFQASVVKVIVDKTVAAARKKKASLIVVGGGVSANTYLRDKLSTAASAYGIGVLFPVLKESIDNGAMIARRAYALHKRGKRSSHCISAQAMMPF